MQLQVLFNHLPTTNIQLNFRRMLLIFGGQSMKLNKISSLNYISKQLDGLLWVLVQVYSFYKMTILYSFSTLTSLAGGMKGADIGLGWIDQGGQVHFQVNTKLSSLLSINTI
jgi:hypothetical protein